jgi:HEAT repeat protein
MTREMHLKPMGADELMAKLNQDPEFVRRRDEKEEYFRGLKQHFAQAEFPLVKALNDAGVTVESVWDLVNTKRPYPEAIPVLIAHLSLSYPYRIREGIARALTTKDACKAGYRALVSEFKKVPKSDDPAAPDFKWALGNAISVVADKSNFDEVADLIRDRSHGSARDMMVLGLPRLDNRRAAAVLIEQLDDVDAGVAGQAVKALAKLKAQEARTKIEHLLHHREAWVRKEAAKALTKLHN